jgi:regulator of nucleoside diphosphate kinase
LPGGDRWDCEFKVKWDKGDIMSGKPIHITVLDLERLRKLLQEAQYTDYRKSTYLDSLREELDRAFIVASRDIPDDVITMNSRVCLVDLDTQEEEIYTLVFPENADLKQGKVSILAPIGTAMLGYEVGDIFEWEVPAGKRKLQVKEILYQPEASGDFDL